MCREVFDGFRATWTDICAACEPKARAMRLAATNRLRTPHPQEDSDED